MPRLAGTILVAQTCTKCGELKDASAFAIDKTARLGHIRRCKRCVTQHVRKWQAENPEKAKSYTLAYNRAEQELRRRHAEEFQELLNLELDRY